MDESDRSSARMRTRREPPHFRPVTVQRVMARTPRLLRVTLASPELAGLAIDEPAASVRLLLPFPGGTELPQVAWTGNEFRLADGRRPVIRTLTPLPAAADGEGMARLEVEVVVHEGGAASSWATRAQVDGSAAAVSGPGRGYTIDHDAPAFLLAGDETAIPAIGQLLEAMPTEVPVQVHVEVAHPDARVAFPENPAVTVVWHDLPAGAAFGDSLVAAVQAAELVAGTRIWVAGEAAAVQRIRRHLFTDRGLPRSEVTVRGYWKHGRAGNGG